MALWMERTHDVVLPSHLPLKTSCFSKSLVEPVKVKLGFVLADTAAGGVRESLSGTCCCGLEGSRDSTQQADSWGRAVSVEG